jgi:iron complex transport system substrate-binding protein
VRQARKSAVRGLRAVKRRGCGAPSAARNPPSARFFIFALIGAVFAPAAPAATQPASRIVSLAPHLTELAFAAGAGEQIVGTVEYSDYPQAARKIPRIGDAFRVDLERVLAVQPQAVLAWESGTPVQTTERLTSLGLHVISIGTRKLQDIPAALMQIGEIAGVRDVAQKAAASFTARIASLRMRYRGRAPVRVFLQVNERPLYTVNGKHIMSEALELCGGRNVFAGLDGLAPTVSLEAVIAADPEVILATDAAAPDAVSYWARWRHIAAVRHETVFLISADNTARATPRFADGVAQVCRLLDEARERIRRRGA